MVSAASVESIRRSIERRKTEDGRGLKRARRCCTQACVRKVAVGLGQVCVRAYFVRNVGVGFPRSRLLTLHGIELDRCKRAPMSPLSSPTYSVKSNYLRPLQGIQLSIGWHAPAFSLAHNTFCQSLTRTTSTTGSIQARQDMHRSISWRRERWRAHRGLAGDRISDIVVNSAAPASLV